MNRAERRQNGIHAVKDAERKAPPRFYLTGAGRIEQMTEDGVKVAFSVFHVMNEDGALLVEHTDDGQQAPVAIVSQPIAVGRALIVPGAPVARA